MKRLSPTQQEVVSKLREHRQPLIRLRGGFWTYRGCPGRIGPSGFVPDWSVGAQTVRAMEKLGLLRRLNVHAEEFRDERGLVDDAVL